MKRKMLLRENVPNDIEKSLNPKVSCGRGADIGATINREQVEVLWSIDPDKLRVRRGERISTNMGKRYPGQCAQRSSHPTLEVCAVT